MKKTDSALPNPHAGHRKRLREKYVCHGIDSLSEAELLELLLFYSIPRVDTRPQAEALLEAFGSVEGVLAATPEERCTITSLPAASEVLFSLLSDLAERTDRPKQKEQFSSPDFLKTYLPRQFFGFRKERAILFFLNAEGTLLHRQTILSHENSFVRLSLRTFVEPARRVQATAILLAHNHPNGIAIPSDADLTATSMLAHALQQEGLSLAEHYIVAGDTCVPILNRSIGASFASEPENGKPDGFDFR